MYIYVYASLEEQRKSIIRRCQLYLFVAIFLYCKQILLHLIPGIYIFYI